MCFLSWPGSTLSCHKSGGVWEGQPGARTEGPASPQPATWSTEQYASGLSPRFLLVGTLNSTIIVLPLYYPASVSVKMQSCFFVEGKEGWKLRGQEQLQLLS